MEPYSNSSFVEEGYFAHPSSFMETFALMATFIALCATAQPSPFAVPMSYYLVYGVTDEHWQSFCEFWASKGVTQYGMIAWGIPGVAALVYWLNGLLLLALDSYWRPEVMSQFKIQKEKKFDTKKIWKVAKNILSNQLFVTLPIGHFYAWLAVHKNLGIYNTPTLPTGMERFCHMIIYVVMDEVVFFYGHWWLHQNTTKWFKYTKVHKIHHEFTSPIALTASYCHPVEMLISNVLPLCGGMFCCGSHLYLGMSWAAFAVLGTQTHHCGYRWPWTPGFDHQPDFHDYHHKKFNTNYGLTGWCDALHGTDRLWKDMIAARELEEKKAGKKSKDPNNWMYNIFIGSFVCMVLLDRYGKDLGIPLESGWGLAAEGAASTVNSSPEL